MSFKLIMIFSDYQKYQFSPNINVEFDETGIFYDLLNIAYESSE